MTFTKGSTTVTINGAIYPFELEFKHHQNVGVAEDGTVRVYDRGLTEKFIGIKFRDKDTNLSAIRSFITSTVKFAKETFTFTPDPDMDAGAGKGTAVTVRYWTDQFKERLFNYNKYEYDMILRVE